jgi:hypothetical protein
MSIRAYKWLTGFLLSAVLVLVWRSFTLHRQIVAASFFSFKCEMVEKFAREQPDPESLARQVVFLTRDYGEDCRILLGSPIANVAQRDFQHALTNALVAFRQITTNDLGGDLSSWVQKYGPH